MALATLGTTDLVDLIGSAIDVILDEAHADDDKVGIVLSGGLDSSTVACVADHIRPGLPTFTAYYDEPGFDEREYADLARHHDHYEIGIVPEDFVENFDAMKPHLKGLRPGMGAFGQWMVAKYLASQGITMAISGEGSDELFGGYARQMIVAGEEPPVGYEDYTLPDGYPTTLREALNYDFAMLPDLLAVDDRMLGAFDIKARAPFTDQRIVEYGLSLPIHERVGKRHLRELVRGIVPDAIIDRKDKRGFPIPLWKWAQVEPVRSFIEARIGYVPDPAKPFSRAPWYDLLDA
jgi:asparagine synthetase B (glutamine-hydrolysing)